MDVLNVQIGHNYSETYNELEHTYNIMFPVINKILFWFKIRWGLEWFLQLSRTYCTHNVYIIIQLSIVRVHMCVCIYYIIIPILCAYVWVCNSAICKCVRVYVCAGALGAFLRMFFSFYYYYLCRAEKTRDAYYFFLFFLPFFYYY